MADYSDEEAEEILKRALSRERKEGISHDDLVAAASEVGIGRADVEAAAAELSRERDQLATRAAVRRELRDRLVRLGTNMAVLNAFMVALDWATGPGLWFHWVALGSAFWLAQRALRTFMPREEDLLRAERRIERRERRRRRREESRRHAGDRKARKKRTEAEFERVVEQGVEALLRGAADRIERYNREQERRVRVESGEPPSADERFDSSMPPRARYRR